MRQKQEAEIKTTIWMGKLTGKGRRRRKNSDPPNRFATRSLVQKLNRLSYLRDIVARELRDRTSSGFRLSQTSSSRTGRGPTERRSRQKKPTVSWLLCFSTVTLLTSKKCSSSRDSSSEFKFSSCPSVWGSIFKQLIGFPRISTTISRLGVSGFVFIFILVFSSMHFLVRQWCWGRSCRLAGCYALL